MQFLRKRYRIVSISEIVASLNDPTAEPGVAVTFDDGYRDVFRHAFPTLRRHEIPATIFLTVDGIENGEAPWYDHIFLALQVAEFDTLELELDQPVRYSLTSPAVRFHSALDIVMRLRKLPDGQRKACLKEIKRKIPTPSHELAGKMLTWEQILTMQRAGVHFGSHTLTHPVVSRLEASQLETELRDSKRLLEEKLGTPVEDFAFPFGHADDCGTAPRPVLVACGYRSAATTIWGVNERGADPFALRRVQIGEERSLDMFAFQLNQLFLRASDPPAGADFPARVEFATPFRSPMGDAEGPR
jgi:peptidoglycan/xylan/chitin deacetylase (PgdA/CDA1 family)